METKQPGAENGRVVFSGRKVAGKGEPYSRALRVSRLRLRLAPDQEACSCPRMCGGAFALLCVAQCNLRPSVVVANVTASCCRRVNTMFEESASAHRLVVPRRFVALLLCICLPRKLTPFGRWAMLSCGSPVFLGGFPCLSL